MGRGVWMHGRQDVDAVVARDAIRGSGGAQVGACVVASGTCVHKGGAVTRRPLYVTHVGHGQATDPLVAAQAPARVG